MLGLRRAPEEDLQSSSVELVYGQALPVATMPTVVPYTLLTMARSGFYATATWRKTLNGRKRGVKPQSAWW